MNIYRVDLQRVVDYDEYDMFVVQCMTRKEAIALAKKEAARQLGEWKATKIGTSIEAYPKDAGVICESFNAG